MRPLAKRRRAPRRIVHGASLSSPKDRVRRPSAPWRVAVVGAGATGGALAAMLVRAGADVALWSRTRTRSKAVARAVGARGVATLDEALAGAELVVLCVRDGALEELVASLARVPRTRPMRSVLHTSGARGRAVLEPLAREGWATGALHPLTALARGNPAVGIPPCGWALETSAARARVAAARVVRACGGHLFTLSARPEERVDYHVAATLLSNGALALWDVVLEDVLPRSLRRPQVRRAMSELLAHTTLNLTRARSSLEALTGPVARGDAATVSAHLERLSGVGRGAARELYLRLSRRLVAIARDGGRIDAQQARTLERIVQSSSARARPARREGATLPRRAHRSR